MSLVVLDPGLASRLVDFGRPHLRSLGVAVGGAADRTALTLANALVGNPPATPALEICLKGPILRATEPTVAVLFGAPFVVSSARRRYTPGHTFDLQPGEELHIGGTPRGMRGYLAVAGGFAAERILDSAAAFENVQEGQVLACPTCLPQRTRFLGADTIRELTGPDGAAAPWELRVLPGLQADWFAGQAIFEEEYLVTPALDRMGVRLEGRPLAFPEREMVSEPVCPGAVQITRNGQPILLGVDGQTIGGYPKIAQVIQADLDRLGQLRPGERVRFRPVTLAQALEAFRRRRTVLHEWVVRLRLASNGS